MIRRGMSVAELAGMVAGALQRAGVTAVLSGGAAVQIYSNGAFVSKDLDFVTPARQDQLDPILSEMGFERMKGQRLYFHPEADYAVEFPAWPLAVGEEYLHEWAYLKTAYGLVQILSPTQCVKDRLAQYLHWRDRQALEQAVAVAQSQPVDFKALRSWARQEGGDAGYERFARMLVRAGR